MRGLPGTAATFHLLNVRVVWHWSHDAVVGGWSRGLPFA
jgi:hypothetical protein